MEALGLNRSEVPAAAIIRPYQQERALEAIERDLEIVYANEEQSRFTEGRLLREIKDTNAYGKKYGERTWAQYLAERWPDLSQQRADERIAAYTVRENHRTFGHIGYSQAVVLSALTPEEQSELVPQVIGLSARTTKRKIAERAKSAPSEPDEVKPNLNDPVVAKLNAVIEKAEQAYRELQTHPINSEVVTLLGQLTSAWMVSTLWQVAHPGKTFTSGEVMEWFAKGSPVNIEASQPETTAA